MKTQDVIDYFGGAREAAEVLGITTQAIYAWGETVPKPRQGHVQMATKGKLKKERAGR